MGSLGSNEETRDQKEEQERGQFAGRASWQLLAESLSVPRTRKSRRWLLTGHTPIGARGALFRSRFFAGRGCSSPLMRPKVLLRQDLGHSPENYCNRQATERWGPNPHFQKRKMCLLESSRVDNSG